MDNQRGLSILLIFIFILFIHGRKSNEGSKLKINKRSKLKLNRGSELKSDERSELKSTKRSKLKPSKRRSGTIDAEKDGKVAQRAHLFQIRKMHTVNNLHGLVEKIHTLPSNDERKNYWAIADATLRLVLAGVVIYCVSQIILSFYPVVSMFVSSIQTLIYGLIYGPRAEDAVKEEPKVPVVEHPSGSSGLLTGVERDHDGEGRAGILGQLGGITGRLSRLWRRDEGMAEHPDEDSDPLIRAERRYRFGRDAQTSHKNPVIRDLNKVRGTLEHIGDVVEQPIRRVMNRPIESVANYLGWGEQLRYFTTNKANAENVANSMTEIFRVGRNTEPRHAVGLIAGVLLYKHGVFNLSALKPLLPVGRTMLAPLRAILDFTKRKWDELRYRLVYGRSPDLEKLDDICRKISVDTMQIIGDKLGNPPEYAMTLNGNYLELKKLISSTTVGPAKLIEHLKYNKVLADPISMSLITKRIISSPQGFIPPNDIIKALNELMNMNLSSDYLVAVLAHEDFIEEAPLMIRSAIVHPILPMFAEYLFGIAKVFPSLVLAKEEEIAKDKILSEFWTLKKSVLSCHYFSLTAKGPPTDSFECDGAKLQEFLHDSEFMRAMDILIQKSGIVGRIYKAELLGNTSKYYKERRLQWKSAKQIAEIISIPKWLSTILKMKHSNLLALSMAYHKGAHDFLQRELGKTVDPSIYAIYLISHKPTPSTLGGAPNNSIQTLQKVFKQIVESKRKVIPPCDVFDKQKFTIEHWLGMTEGDLHWRTISPATKESILDLVIMYRFGMHPSKVQPSRPISHLGFKFQLSKRLKAYCRDRKAKKEAKGVKKTKGIRKTKEINKKAKMSRRKR